MEKKVFKNLNVIHYLGLNPPIHLATKYGSVLSITALVNGGACVDTLNDKKETPLMIAIKNGDLPMVSFVPFLL